MPTKHTHTRLQNLLLTLLFLGDLLFCYIGLTLGYLLRFQTPLKKLGLDTKTSLELYQPLIWVGIFFLSATFIFLKVYDTRLLLRPHRVSSLIIRAFGFWFLSFLSISLVLKFEPDISRLFVAASFVTTIATILIWRYLFYLILSKSRARQALVQRVMIVGWNEESARLSHSIETDPNRPYELVGVVSTHANEYTKRMAGKHHLGEFHELDSIVESNQPHILVVADVDLNRDQLLQVSKIAERHYARFTIIPSFFQIFVANLRMQTLSGEPVLGHDDPKLNHVANRLVKRIVDLFGSTIGLLASAPIVLTLALMIRREDPGPVFFVQERIGQNGQPFGMIKLRSMRIGADKHDHANQSTLREDPRVLSIGKFIRRWNLDEVPQFWNVFCGDMSLVGPRPERTYHANRLSREIPNYASRHLVKPGLTGWAQVNGYRGDTDLTQRVKFDLYYIENWSMVFDLQIMVLTFFKRDNAY